MGFADTVVVGQCASPQKTAGKRLRSLRAKHVITTVNTYHQSHPSLLFPNGFKVLHEVCYMTRNARSRKLPKVWATGRPRSFLGHLQKEHTCKHNG